MNIVIYSHYFLPIPGGVQTIVLELARGLSEWRPSDADAETFDVTVITEARGSSVDDDPWPFRLVRCPSFKQLWNLLRSADVVHLAGPALLPMIFGLALRKPLIIEHHGFQTACPNGSLFFEPAQAVCPGYYMAGQYAKCFQCNRTEVGPARSILRVGLTPLRRWLSNRANINITPTQWLGGILRLNRMATVHHGITQPRVLNCAPPSKPTFAFQGRLVSAKGVEVLLKAAKLLREQRMDFHVKIIGDGPEMAVLRRQAASMDGQVEFLGHLGGGRLDEALAQTTAVIMPSTGGEVFGLVAAENMSRRKLVIVSDIGALKEVVGPAGLVFPAGDAEALASCMRRVLEEPQVVESLGLAARDRAARLFNRDAMIERHVLLYREAASKATIHSRPTRPMNAH